ncbi:hypothetical protein SBRCBS47491_004658 [Sporothrix bragantina]|uniref:Glycosyl hydrolase family 59 C-terminal lectin domain-containing protein n=1 Tax=Sporothrix bragantina TaxID=671064 RepID=A0ABP0BQ88_9PEZI
MKFQSTIQGLLTTSLAALVVADGQGAYLWDPHVDNEANVYARVIELQHTGNSSLDGTLLATWEHWYTTNDESSVANGTAGSYILRRSADAGATWSTLTTITDTDTGPGHPFAQFWQPFLFEFPIALGDYPAGTLLLVGNLVPKNMTVTSFYTWRSTDHGQTWKRVGGAWQQGGAPGAGIWEPFLYLDNQDRLVAVFSDERDNTTHSQMLVHVVSEDGGETWGNVVQDVASTTQTDRPGMASVALMDNGQYAMSYEVCGRTNCPIFVKTSDDGVTWDASDLGSPVVTDDALLAGSSPYTVWDPSTNQLVLASHSIWDVSTDTTASELHRAVFTNDKYGTGNWSWSPAPWYVSNASAACNSNYSPHLLPQSSTKSIRYTAPASEGDAGLCSERTAAAPVGVLPYVADFASNGQLGWINFGGDWSVDDDTYNVGTVGNIDARAVTGSSGWTDYTISADAKIVGSAGGIVGLTARVTAPMNGLDAFEGYTAAINTFTGNLTVSREAHAMVVLESRAHPGGIVADTWYQLTFTVKGYQLTATLTSASGSSNVTYTVVDDSFQRGMAGLLVNDGAGTFQNVAIEEV